MRIKNHLGLRPLLFIQVVNFVMLVGVTIWLSPQSHAQTTAQPTAESCHKFVQEFYNWYLKGYSKETNGITIDTVFKERGSHFTPVLKQQLKLDEKAAAANPQEVVGLDFDPFLAAQDTAERCIVGKVTTKGDTYHVEVFEVFSGKKGTKPAVVPELTFKNGEWVFTNFGYPGDKGKMDDLLSVLKALAKERAQTASENHHPVR